jgi:hypothetical protein
MPRSWPTAKQLNKYAKLVKSSRLLTGYPEELADRVMNDIARFASETGDPRLAYSLAFIADKNGEYEDVWRDHPDRRDFPASVFEQVSQKSCGLLRFDDSSVESSETHGQLQARLGSQQWESEAPLNHEDPEIYSRQFNRNPLWQKLVDEVIRAALLDQTEHEDLYPIWFGSSSGEHLIIVHSDVPENYPELIATYSNLATDWTEEDWKYL